VVVALATNNAQGQVIIPAQELPVILVLIKVVALAVTGMDGQPILKLQVAHLQHQVAQMVLFKLSAK
jgi:hypothetical protein